MLARRLAKGGASLPLFVESRASTRLISELRKLGTNLKITSDLGMFLHHARRLPDMRPPRVDLKKSLVRPVKLTAFRIRNLLAGFGIRKPLSRI